MSSTVQRRCERMHHTTKPNCPWQNIGGVCYLLSNSIFINPTLSRACDVHVRIMLSRPTWPYWRKFGLHWLFKTTIKVDLTKRPSYGKSSNRCSIIVIALNLSGHSKMGLFLNIVLKLCGSIHSDVGNVRKIKYFRDYFRPFRKMCNTI